jgi:pSer/pThr/pTyr-binding forkhead associated (FHA) protein
MAAPMTNSFENVLDSGPVYVVFEFERRAYPIGLGPFTIGRAASCDIIVREPAVSRVHAELNRVPSRGVVLRPVGATPTVVNGVALTEETALRHGDQIEIGSARLTLSEHSLPLGVSIVDRTRRKPSDEDIANRRPTITNPILAGLSNPNQSAARRFSRPAILLGILAVIIAYYFGMMIR